MKVVLKLLLHQLRLCGVRMTRLRATLVELAWLWLRYQPGCALSRWFHDRLGGSRGRLRKVMIVALARKLLIALWRYLQDGAVPQGMELKPA